MKGLFKHLWVVFPIVMVVIYIVSKRMDVHDETINYDKLRLIRDQYQAQMLIAESKAEKKQYAAKIKEIDDELKDAKERKVAARKAEDETRKDFDDEARKFSKELDDKDRQKGNGKDVEKLDPKELKELQDFK